MGQVPHLPDLGDGDPYLPDLGRGQNRYNKGVMMEDWVGVGYMAKGFSTVFIITHSCLTKFITTVFCFFLVFFFFLQDRVLTAKAMIERLRQTQRAKIINDMETLCDAYISLANWDVDKYKKETS